jgi:MFS family permease
MPSTGRATANVPCGARLRDRALVNPVIRWWWSRVAVPSRAVHPRIAVTSTTSTPDLRHNVAALGADYALFLIGLSFASQATILPAFATHLGASNLVIGAIPALMTLGWFLPSLLAAHHTRTLPRKLPFVLRYTGAERVPFLILAALAFTMAEEAPRTTLALMLVLLLVITGTGGALMPAWMEIIAQTIPLHLRGRFFGLWSSVAGAVAFVGSFATAYVLSAIAAPASYGVCFLAAAACMGLSWIALALVREPPAPTVSPPLPLPGFFAMVLDILRADRNLVRFLVARAFMGVANMSGAFFTVYALRGLGAPAWQVGVFTGALLLGQVVGNGALGWLADRMGGRAVLLVGAASLLGANGIALTTTSLEIYGSVFALAGIFQASMSVAAGNMLLDFAPRAEERPTYVGLGNTALAPVLCTAPLVAGLVADTLGLRAVFAIALGGALLAMGFLGRVREPRTAARGLAA